MLNVLVGSTVQICQQPIKSALEDWYQSTLLHIPEYTNLPVNFFNEHTAVRLLLTISSNVHFQK
jgi:hypothetical protein